MRLPLALGLVACVAHSASACSKPPFLSVRFPGIVSFIGRASADTALAGAGPIRATAEATRPIFGQVVQVERLGSGVGRSVGARGQAMDIVVVPWGYRSDCRPIPWAGSARWVPVNTRGVFTGYLRDSADWIGGRPTIDVHTTFSVPYTSAATRFGIGRGPQLTPDEMLDLNDALPFPFGRDADSASVRTARDVLQRWVRDHPDLVTRYPAKQIVEEARSTLSQALLTSTRSPANGTYRFVIHFATGDSATVFARTEAFPVSTLWTLTPGAEPTYSADGFPEGVGYEVLVQTAPTERELTSSRDLSPAAARTEGYLVFVERPVDTSRDSTVWRGSADIIGALSRSVRDSALAARLRAAEKDIGDRIAAKAASLAEGRFIGYPNGRMRFEVRNALYSIRGERLSATTLAPH